MTIRCEVCGHLQFQGSSLSFFPWPTDSCQRKYWQTCLGLQEINLNKPELFVCSDHFDPMQMIRKGTALRKDAFPKRYVGPIPIFPSDDESPKIEAQIDSMSVKNEEGCIFGGTGPSGPIFDDEEIMPEELSMAKLVQMFAAAAKERPSEIVPLVTPIAEETKAFSNILIDRQESYLNSYCKSCLRQAELVNMLEANCEGVPVTLLYKTVFMSEINASEIPQMMCATCIGLLFQCFKFSTMTTKSTEVLQAARERFKYLPALDDGTIDLKNIPQKYSTKSSTSTEMIQSDDEDRKQEISVAKKRKTAVKTKEAPEKKKGRRTSVRRASEKAKKVSKKLLEESDDDESNNDNLDNEEADPDFDTAAYEVKDESPDVSDTEDHKEEDNVEEDPEDNYCMLCRHNFSNMVRHMDKVHRVDWESKSCERCKCTIKTARKLFNHVGNHEKLKCCNCFIQYDDQKGLDLHMTYSTCAWKLPHLRVKRPKKTRAPFKVTIKPDFICKLCEFDCDTFKKIFEHFQSDHQESLTCVICRKSCRYKFSLMLHYKAHGKNLFCSDHCQAFDSNDDLLAHYKTPGHDVQCVICLKTFETKEMRDKHKRLCQKKSWRPPKEEVLCPHCPVIFSDRGKLSIHITRTHGNRTFMCEVCGNAGARTLYCRPIGTDEIACNFCNKRFNRRKRSINNLYKHIDTHLEPKHCCEICGKKFTIRPSLLVHYSVHSNERPHACEVCGVAYKERTSLYKHRKIHRLENTTGGKSGNNGNIKKSVRNAKACATTSDNDNEAMEIETR